MFFDSLRVWEEIKCIFFSLALILMYCICKAGFVSIDMYENGLYVAEQQQYVVEVSWHYL